MTPRIRILLAVSVLALAAGTAAAQVPSTLTSSLWGFPLPGDHPSPATARSAGVALADRWLGGAVQDNPAARPAAAVEVTGQFMRVNRMDLAAQNRSFDKTFGFPDFASASVSFGRGPVLYAYQPVLRMEEQTYTRGPFLTPAQVGSSVSQRELRVGVAQSLQRDGMRLGVAAEWVSRRDRYETVEVSGSPDAGERAIAFDGSGFGASAGFAYERESDRVGGVSLGGALRYGSELTLDGDYTEALLSGNSAGTFRIVRDAEWSGGLSAAFVMAPATRVLIALSGRSGGAWNEEGVVGGLALEAKSGLGWSAGLEWKDPELNWGARFGAGQEAQSGSFEKKSGLLSVGFTFDLGGVVLDAALLHRNLARDGAPSSAEDRALAGVRVDF
jgi:hypothetical protein